MQKEERESGERLLREHIRELCGERRSPFGLPLHPPPPPHMVCNCSIEVGGGDHILGGIFGGWFESMRTDMAEGGSVGGKACYR